MFFGEDCLNSFYPSPSIQLSLVLSSISIEDSSLRRDSSFMSQGTLGFSKVSLIITYFPSS